MCCATVIRSVADAKNVVTNTTSYQCVPLEFANYVGTYVLSSNTNYTSTCINTTRSTPTHWSYAGDEACPSSTHCCAARGAAVSTG